MLFCDLVGSTALSTRLDPEDMRDIVRSYQSACAQVIAAHDGFLAQFLGDGILAFFGYPRAHEDEAERAVRAAIAMVAAVGKLTPRPEVRLLARIGIATGLVVIGDLLGEGAAQDRGVVGETPNLAARLQALAAPGAIVISDGMRRLLGGLFECRDLGPIELKGFDTPQRAWEVERESAIESRFEAFRATDAAELIGRDEELELLLRRWSQAKRGDGRVVLLSGEPGIGKSRLIAALHERIMTEPHLRLRYFCLQHHQDSALHPVIAQLERAAGFVRDDTAEAKLSKLEALLAPASPQSEEMTLIAELLSIPLPNRYPPLALLPQRKKEKTFESLMRQLEALSRVNPVVMIYEDLHWIDPTSRELLDIVVDRVQSLPVLLLITFRPDFVPPWIGRSHITLLALNRLGTREGEAMITAVASDKALPRAVVEQIIAHTDGIPLFIEELTKAVLESGILREEAGGYALDGPLPPLAIPTTLQSSLMARLDRLAPAREVAQIGAAIGRQFSYERLAAVARLPEDRLRDALTRLVEAELVFARGTPPDANYVFKHALIQDAAYATLVRERRQELHARIAVALERDEGIEPELLAHHLAEAGETARAAQSWLEAGRRAAQRSANAEAIAHFKRGIAAMMSLPDDPERAKVELHLLIALGAALMSTVSSASPEVVSTYARARALARKTGQAAELFPALWGSWLVAFSIGDLGSAGALVKELHTLAHDADDNEFVFQAHHAGWPTLLAQGDLAGAQRSLEAGIPLYRRDAYRRHAVTYGGHDPGVCGHGLAGMTYAIMGHLDRARSEADSALILAKDLAHRPSLSHAYWLANETSYLRRDTSSVGALAAEMLAFVKEHGTALAVANATVFRAWALIAGGNRDEGVAALRDGVSRWQGTGSRFNAPYRVVRMADAMLLAGEAEEALRLVNEGFRLSAETGEHWSDAELERLAGEAHRLLDTKAGGAVSEAYFLRALAAARAIGARLFELRAATALARLWHSQNNTAAARDLLVPAYNWFTEGFDTTDVKEAKEVIDRLD